MKSFTRLALASVIAMGVASTSARADLITSLLSTAVAADGNYAYTYQVTLTGSTQLIGTSTSDSNGNLAGTSEFGTVFDFGSLVLGANGMPIISATGEMTNFNYTFALTNTPAATTNSFVDDPTLANIRFTYLPTNTLVYVDGQGYTAPAGTAEIDMVANTVGNLGTFTVESPNGPTTRRVSYDGSAFKSTNNTPQVNGGQTAAPLAPSIAVPEPASMALLGAGLIGAGMFRRRSAKAA